jgi:uncharacterized protein (TIGR02145 family)
MKATIILISAFVIPVAIVFGQRPTMELTFTAIDSAAWVQLDSIKIMNRTQGGSTVLVYPDTVLLINYVGIHDNQDAPMGFSIGSFPNPVTENTIINLYIPDEDFVRISVTDLLGRQVIGLGQKLQKGTHTFSFTPGGERLYLITAEWKGFSRNVKIVNLSKNNGQPCSLSYEGFDGIMPRTKALEAVPSFDYNPGDTLLYIGYIGNMQSGILDAPETSETFTFQFATNIPCPGTPMVDYEGQIYNTIQIFSQCWLKENLNVGWMIPGIENMGDNGSIEKYCFNDNQDSCVKYGGLYQWNEMMQYTTQQGTQGICPPGWRIPTDEEWKVLEGAGDKQYGIGDETWDGWGYRGYDAGKNLKTTSDWMLGGNGNDLFGFSGLPGGSFNPDYGFVAIGFYGDWWSSTEGGVGARDHYLNYDSPGAGRSSGPTDMGICVRCLKDN